MKKCKFEFFKKLFAIRKPIYKTWWIYFIVILVSMFLVFGIPIIINEIYMKNSGYTTLWGANEVLSFYSVVLSGIISISVLVVTLYFSKKDTEKQIKYYMSQTKAPFFVISYIEAKGRSFIRQKNGTWSQIFTYTKNGILTNSNDREIIIHLSNIGEGIALTPTYSINMFADTVIPTNIVNNKESIALFYDLQENLNDKYVNYHFKENLKNVIFHTYINLNYKNMLGVNMLQTITVDIKPNSENNNLEVLIREISPQSYTQLES